MIRVLEAPTAKHTEGRSMAHRFTIGVGGAGRADCGLGVATAASRRKDGESSPRFTGRGRHDTTPFTIPFTTHPRGWLSRVAVEGGSTTLNESVMAMAQSAQAFRVRAERKLKLS